MVRDMCAFVSDQSGAFESLVIGTGPDFTVVAALGLPGTALVRDSRAARGAWDVRCAAGPARATRQAPATQSVPGRGQIASLP